MQDTHIHDRARLDRLLARDHERIGEWGRTLLYDHGVRTPRAAVLFHGMSAAPMQFSAVAQALYDRGFNVLVPRLPRHGYGDRMSDAAADLTAEQLKRFASESVGAARALGERVIVVGFSLGGLLAAYVAQHEPVDSAIAVSPFLGIMLMPSLLRLPFALWTLRRRNRFGWWDPIKRERQQPEHGYPRYASHAVAHALTIAHDLLESARSTAPKAGRIVLVTNTHETTVNNRAIVRLLERWRRYKPQGVETHAFADLPRSHDIIEPLRHPEISARVRSVLVDLIDR